MSCCWRTMHNEIFTIPQEKIKTINWTENFNQTAFSFSWQNIFPNKNDERPLITLCSSLTTFTLSIDHAENCLVLLGHLWVAVKANDAFENSVSEVYHCSLIKL